MIHRRPETTSTTWAISPVGVPLAMLISGAGYAAIVMAQPPEMTVQTADRANRYGTSGVAQRSLMIQVFNKSQAATKSITPERSLATPDIP